MSDTRKGGFRNSRWFCGVTIVAWLAYEIGVPPMLPKLVGGFAAQQLATGAAFVLVEILLLWLLLRLRADSLADIGLKRPKSWLGTIIGGIGVAIFLYLVIAGLEQVGYTRDLSRFAKLKGDLPAASTMALYLLFAAGFFEEYVYRGFVMQSFAKLGGGGRFAWLGACVIQAALFSLGHLYQGLHGVILAGGVALLLGAAFLVTGRNLWIFIIGHALYDSGRVIYFYFAGVPQVVHGGP